MQRRLASQSPGAQGRVGEVRAPGGGVAGSKEEGEEFLFLGRRRVKGERVRVDALELGAEKGHDGERGGLMEEGEVDGEEKVEGEEVGEGDFVAEGYGACRRW